MTDQAMLHPGQKTWFGHPRGLFTLFFTEMWERFSYYGMRAILIFFMIDSVRGGMAMSKEDASLIYGLYTFGVYALALPGGWIADRLIGQKRSVLIGGIVIAAGHFTLAVPSVETFYMGLVLVVLGTGLLKPNVSSIVADLYPEGGGRRDAGFSIFYMGINIGSVLGQITCGYLGEKVDWHWGFGAAGVGMTLGLIQYVWGYNKNIKGIGGLKEDAGDATNLARSWRRFWGGLITVLAIIGGLYALMKSGTVAFSVSSIVYGIAYIVSGIVALYFTFVLAAVCKDKLERGRVVLMLLLFIGAGVFWAGFEQAGSSMNVFAKDYTDLLIAGWEIPASWMQNLNPLFIVILAPIMGMMWVKLADRNPSIPMKFGYGLLLMGVGFFVLAWGATYVGPRGGDAITRVSPNWLVVTYFFHTVGELCLSPIGLSAFTKLAPQRIVSQMMGIWFMAAALGNLIAGLVASQMESMPMEQIFQTVAIAGAVAGVFFIFLAKPFTKLAGGIK